MKYFMAICALFAAAPVAAQLQYGATSQWRVDVPVTSENQPCIAWTKTVGDGRSQVVGDDRQVFVTSGSGTKQDDGETKIAHVVTALSTTTGDQLWRREYTSTMYDDQETFSGAAPSPRCTPLVVSDKVITVGFTGDLRCFDRDQGKLLWYKDLVQGLDGDPVQFGFSSSVVVAPGDANQFCVLAAGETGGFYCLNSNSGDVIWKAECRSASYSTPMIADFAGVRQWVIVSEREVIGVDCRNGQRLWEWKLPKQELTNVPTPLIIDDSRMIVSGQGCQGTCSLKVIREGGNWQVSQQWAVPKPQFFYTNWLRLNDRVIVGCTSQYLAAIDIETGELLGRWRGFSDGNIVRAADKLLIVGDKGRLSVFDFVASGSSQAALSLGSQYQVGTGRCWTPLSAAGERGFLRIDDQLMCLSFAQNTAAQPLKNVLTTTRQFKLSVENPAAKVDHVAEIFAKFEAQGALAALGLYQQLRSQKKLNEDDRVALAEAANEQGMGAMAVMIISEAQQDFPDSKRIAAAAKQINGK